ncbi:MAG: hypothetical protein INF48_10795 [Rhodobacter sp.]|nr:hypothetical protein [Rhodobacter sp.]
MQELVSIIGRVVLALIAGALNNLARLMSQIHVVPIVVFFCTALYLG